MVLLRAINCILSAQRYTLCVLNNINNMIHKLCRRLSTARGPCPCNISWMQANLCVTATVPPLAPPSECVISFWHTWVVAWLQVTHTKNDVPWPMTLKFNSVIEVEALCKIPSKWNKNCSHGSDARHTDRQMQVILYSVPCYAIAIRQLIIIDYSLSVEYFCAAV